MGLQQADMSRIQEGNKTVFCQLWHHDCKDLCRYAGLLRPRESTESQLWKTWGGCFVQPEVWSLVVWPAGQDAELSVT